MNDEHDDAEAGDAQVWGTTAFTPGEHVGLVSRRTVGIVARDNPSTRARLWALVSSDAPLDDVLDDLSSTGLKALPDFGLAQVEGSAVRVVARGEVIVSAEHSDGSTHDIDPAGVRTWIEELVDDVVAVSISFADADAGPDADGDFAVLAGSVPACALRRRFDVEDSHAAAAEADGWAGAVGAVQAPTAMPEDTGPDDAVDALEADAESSGVADDVTELVDEAIEAAVAPASEPPSHAVPDVDLQMPEDDDEPDGLDTDAPPDVAPSVEWFDDADGDDGDRPVIPPQPDADPVAAADSAADRPPPDAAPAAVQPAPPVVAQPAPPVVPAAPPSGPGTGAPPPATVPPSTTPSGPPPPGAVPGPPPTDATVAEPDPPAPMPASSVSALFDDAAETTAVAPAGLGRSAATAVLVFSNGERVAVDRPVLIGRNPKASGVDGVLPHIMKFDGPGQGLSRTHAEVRVEDGVLIVEDLNSTNGTEVEIPGQPRARLAGGVPVAIGPGALIDFGDDLHLTVESGT
ncbi:MAG: FHA domain-containing protein [Ilumatobacter sp.]